MEDFFLKILKLSCRHKQDDYSNEDFKIRRCSNCRLQRSFQMGMKVEFIRSDEENIRYKQLIQQNREKQELFRQQQQQQRKTLISTIFLHGNDWNHLSNIVSAYETHCLETFVQQRMTMYPIERSSIDQSYGKHLVDLPMSFMISLREFLHSLPLYHTLKRIDQIYLNHVNLRPLIFMNMFEIRQTCYFESWQNEFDHSTWRFICGEKLYEKFLWIEDLSDKLLITDPIIIRLWIIILFFSTSLSCLYEKSCPTREYSKEKTSLFSIQNTYVELLWKYLLHRYRYENAVRIYSNLTNLYLKMQHIGFAIGVQVRHRSELIDIHRKMNQLVFEGNH